MVDYSAYLDQDVRWPSDSNGEEVLIRDMEAWYAFNAWKKLRAKTVASEWGQIKHSELSNALLRQALTEDFVALSKATMYYPSTTFYPPEAEAGIDEEHLLEACFDALQAMDRLESDSHPLHVLKRVKLLTQFIANHPNINVKEIP